jgi:hypothetical protein
MHICGSRGKPSRYTVEDVRGMERMQLAGFPLRAIAAKYRCAISTVCEFINHAEEIMTHPNKRRGNDLEREIVNMAAERGLPAKRAWGSNGKALGEHETVDLLLAGLKVQAKRRKKIASFLEVPDACDAVVFRQDRKPAMVLMSLERLFELLKRETEDGEKVG